MSACGLSINKTRRCAIPFLVLLLSSSFCNVAVSQRQKQATVALTSETQPATRNFNAGRDEHDEVQRLKEIQSRVKSLLPKILPCVVAIESGSGVVVSSDGLILTASHVAGRPGRTVKIQFSDGREVEATTLGTNRFSDTSALRINAPGPWPFLPVADPGKLPAGTWCLSVGFPSSFPRDQPASVRLGRILVNDRQEIITDCPIMGGDSGGALVSLNGNLIGINSRVKNGIHENYHIPATTFHREWKQILGSSDIQNPAGSVGQRAYLGLQAESDESRVRIRSVHPNSPAQTAGLLAEDVILTFDGKRITHFDEILELIDGKKPGDQVETLVNRSGRLFRYQMTLGGQNRAVNPSSNAKDDRSSIDTSSSSASLVEFHGRNSHSIKRSLSRSEISVSSSIIKIANEHRADTLGTIVSHDGLVVAKLSELAPSFRCQLPSGQELDGHIVGADVNRDLALIRIDAQNLTAISFDPATSLPQPGDILITHGFGETTVGLGVVSVKPGELPVQQEEGGREVVWGLEFDPVPEVRTEILKQGPLSVSGLRLTRVASRSFGESTHLLVNDLVVSINGEATTRLEQWNQITQAIEAGQLVKVEIIRNGQRYQATSTTRSRSQRTPHDRWGGGPVSERRFELGHVIIHDTVIRPEECGSPVMNLEGKVIGINIARVLRVASFAISIQEVQKFVRSIEPNAALH